MADGDAFVLPHRLGDRSEFVGRHRLPVLEGAPPDHGTDPFRALRRLGAIHVGSSPHLLADESGLALEVPGPVVLLDPEPFVEFVGRHGEGEDFDDHRSDASGELRPDAEYGETVLIAQITDCHIVEPGSLMADRIDSAATLRRVLQHLADAADVTMPRPDLIIATGDLVNDGRPSQYDRLEGLLAEVAIPVVPLPGNHDDRSELRRRFSSVLPQGGPETPIDHVIDLGPVRIVLLDTQRPGRVGGGLDDDQLAWLDEVLGREPERPTIVFQHHPPFVTGISFMDAEPFDGAEAYAEVLVRHSNVEMVSCGHLHRAITRRFGGTVVSTWPSTCAQIDLAIGSSTVAYVDEPPAYVLHHWEPAVGLRSHLRTVGHHERWTPNWALGRM